MLSDGLCIGNIVKWTDDFISLDCTDTQTSQGERRRQTLLNEDAECKRFCEVKSAVATKLTSLLSCAENNTIAAGDAASEEAEIMRSYIAILNDPELEKDVVRRIREQKVFFNRSINAYGARICR